MAIFVRVTGVFLGSPMNESFEEEYREGDTPKKIFARLDKRKALGRRFFHSVVKGNRGTFLLNGNRFDMPAALKDPLKDGDEISILSAIAGGSCGCSDAAGR
jgi:molybdopterin converting factor small subunit